MSPIAAPANPHLLAALSAYDDTMLFHCWPPFEKNWTEGQIQGTIKYGFVAIRFFWIVAY